VQGWWRLVFPHLLIFYQTFFHFFRFFFACRVNLFIPAINNG
jgi:hypothetical protein